MQQSLDSRFRPHSCRAQRSDRLLKLRLVAAASLLFVFSGDGNFPYATAIVSQLAAQQSETELTNSETPSRERKTSEPSALDRALQSTGGDWKSAAEMVGAQCKVDASGRLVEFEWGSYPEVNDAELRTISRETTLKSLDLSSASGVTDVGLGHLQTLSQMETLNIHFQTISDLGVMQLASLKKLKTLLIVGAHISEDARAVLREELPSCDVSGIDSTVR